MCNHVLRIHRLGWFGKSTHCIIMFCTLNGRESCFFHKTRFPHEGDYYETLEQWFVLFEHSNDIEYIHDSVGAMTLYLLRCLDVLLGPNGFYFLGWYIYCENLSSHSLSCQLFDLVFFLEVEGYFCPLNCVMALEGFVWRSEGRRVIWALNYGYIYFFFSNGWEEALISFILS